jgi:predicted ArsR family transcriptional regulator
MKSIRDLILEFFDKNQSASVSDLSLALHVTRADVRYHLKQIAAEGGIERFKTIKSDQKGRPGHLYRIPPKAQPNNYLQIAKILLSLDFILQGKDDLPATLAAAMAASIPAPKQRIRQLNQLMRFLDDHGYRASWEAFHTGPRILFRNCPYSEILQDHPEFCKMDRILLEKYLSIDFEQVQKIERETGKFPSCIFLVNNRKQEK